MKQLFMDIEPWAMQECDSRGKGDRQGETAKGQDFLLEMTSGPQHCNGGGRGGALSRGEWTEIRVLEGQGSWNL